MHHIFSEIKIPGRFSEWWNYKTPFLATLIYGHIILTGELLAFRTWGLFLVSYIALASFGYFINDLFDIDSDLAGHKFNRVSTMSYGSRYAFLILSAAGSLLPWIWLPGSSITFSLLFVEFALLLLYAMPVIRLKNRGWIAVVTDSCYAFVIPILLTLSIFDGVKYSSAWPLIALSFLMGIRNILMHQYKDFEADKLAGTPTIATIYGNRKAKRIIEYWIFPLELVVGLTLVFYAKGIFYVLPVSFIIYTFFIYFRESYFYIQNATKLPENYGFLSDVLLNGFYIKWMPLFFLTAVVWIKPFLYWLIPFHCLFFFQVFIDFINDLKFLYHRIRALTIRYYFYYLTLAYQRVYLPVKTMIIKQ